MPSQRRIVPRLIAVSAVIATALSAALLLSGTASAAGPTASRDAALDKCPGNAAPCQDSQRFATIKRGTGGITVRCVIAGRGGSWYYVNLPGQEGFVAASSIAGAPGRLSDCQTIPGIRASLWATALDQQAGDGAVHPSRAAKADADRIFHHGARWGTPPDWSGDCVMFAGLAWNNAGRATAAIRPNAGNAKQQAAAGPLNKTGTPYRGALVFWGRGAFGHVAVSLGNGWVATTNGDDGNQRPNSVTTIAAISQYNGAPLGWRDPIRNPVG